MLDQKMARVTGRQVPTPFTSGRAQVLGLIIKDLPTDSADEARITEGKGQYSIDGSSWTDMDKIDKSELLKLVDLALTDEFFMEPYRKELIRNPAHEIIYRNIHAKIEELVTKKDRFKDESEQLYREAIQKYRTQ